MRLRLRLRHCLPLVVVVLATVVFYGVAGFPLQVALALALLCWALTDVLDPRGRRP